MKKLVIAAALAGSFVSHANATAVLFDPTGTGNAATAISVETFDWLPGNALAIGALSSPTGLFQTVAQSSLSTFVLDSTSGSTAIAPPGVEFTFQASFYEQAVGLGGTNASFVQGAGPSYFKMYASAANSNSITGAGYGDGTLILEGSLIGLTGTFTDFSQLLAAAFPPKLLDSNGADNQNGVMSHVGVGSTSLDVKVTYLNSAYFLDSVSMLKTLVVLDDDSNLTDPFDKTNPSDQVVGVTPIYSLVGGQAVNGAACTSGGVTEAGVAGGVFAQCDYHFQTDSSTSFVIPEPGSLALVGAALAGIAGLRRRKSA